MIKINPLAAWTQDDVDAYVAEHQVPVNPLFELGLRLDRLRAVHPAGRARRGRPRRPLGGQQQDGVRHPHLSADRRQDGPMPRPPRLSPDEIAAALHGLPLWSGDGDGLRRTVELPSFRDAVAAIVAIADVAEEMDHHPDIDLRWRTLHLTRRHATPPAASPSSTCELARRIDALLPG